MKLKVNGMWTQFLAPMRNREAFTTHGSLYGRPKAAGWLGPCEQLPKAYDDSLRSADYVIVSYSTAIAWHVPYLGWVMPAERYSVTTSKQQGRIAPCVAALNAELQRADVSA